jgi:predicted nucleic acid-binding Zn ribbon protein
MARKELGHIELQWTCPNCGGINPGPDKVCNTCGAPQPEDVQFEQPERQELITDKEVETKAEAGADIHCPFCGTRNPAGAKICSQCGGDLVEGRKRETGHVVGAYQTGPAAKVH